MQIAVIDHLLGADSYKQNEVKSLDLTSTQFCCKF